MGRGSWNPKYRAKMSSDCSVGGAAFHDVVFARVSGCDVVRLYDWELRMRKLACLFFPKRGVVKEMDIRAENIGALEADIGLAVPAADAWVHVNAGLPCQDGSKANRRRKPAQLRGRANTRSRDPGPN